jgi:hypothetical protein
MFLEFLKEFASLSHAEQKVFLFCLEHNPHPQAYTGDLQYIAACTGLYYQTVRQALHAISVSPTLSKVVKYIHPDVSAPVMVSLDAAGDIVGREREWMEIGERLDLEELADQGEFPAYFPTVKNKVVDNEQVKYR